MKQRLYNLLRWSERYTKTDMIYLTKGGFWLTAAKVLSIGASFLSSVAFANWLPEETYGIYRYVLSVAALLAIPTLHGIDTALSRAIAQGNTAAARPALYTRMKWGVLGALGGLVLAAYYYWAGNTTLALVFVIAGIFMPFMDPFHIYVAILNGQRKFDRTAFCEVATRLITAVLLAVAVWYSDRIVLVVFLYFLSNTVLRFFFLYLSVRALPREEGDGNDVTTYGKHLSAMSVLGLISTQLDKILVFQQIGGTALATFYLALMPFKQIQTIFNGISTLALPKFSANSMGALRATLPRKLLRMYLIIAPTVVGYILIAPYAFAVLFPQYTEAVPMSQIFMLQLLLFPMTLIGVAITAQEQKKKLYINSTTYAVVRIGLLLVLVPTFGVYGAVAAIMGTTLISSAVLLFLFLKA